MVACNCSAWAASSSAVEDISSDADVFCCVTLSSCWIAALIWAALMVGAGYILGATIADAVEANFGIASIALLVAGLAVLVLGFRFTAVRETRT